MGGQVEYLLAQWEKCQQKNPTIKIDDFLLLKQVPKPLAERVKNAWRQVRQTV